MADVVALTDTEGTFASLREAFGVDDDSAWWLPFNAFLVRTGGAIVLVDTGVGPAGSGDPFLEQRAGRLPELLSAAAVQPEDVDLVVFTHLHVDHVGWNMRDGSPFFPSARYVSHRADFDNFTTRYPDRRYVRDQLVALHATGRLELIDESSSPFPGVEIEHVPGHTAGSCVVTIEGGDVPRRRRRPRAPARRSRRGLRVRGGPPGRGRGTAPPLSPPRRRRRPRREPAPRARPDPRRRRRVRMGAGR